MIRLLDVNVLVALFDPGHVHHEPAHAWFAGQRQHGWATCPATENGLVRILSNPRYPGRRTTASDAADRLRAFVGSGDHVFWPADVSLLDPARVRLEAVRGHGDVSDVHLLLVAVRHGGGLATFDRKLAADAVVGAESAHILTIPAA